jgi:hypothetical protein
MEKLKQYKYIVALAIIILGVILYQYEKREFLANSIKCKQEGMKLFEKELEDLGVGNFPKTPQFQFSKKMNTCLYLGGHSFASNGDSFGVYYVKDVYSNKFLASYRSYTIKKETTFDGDREEYLKLVDEYFAE